MPEVEQDRHSQQRAALWWVLRAGALGAALVAVFNLVLFFVTGAWQMLAVCAGEALVLACVVPAAWLGRRSRFEAAGYWVLLGTAIAFLSPEMLHKGITAFVAAGGAVTLIAAGMLLLPRKWPVWVAAEALFGTAVWLINRAGLPRFSTESVGPSVRIAATVAISLVAIAIIWRLVLAYRNILAIQVRLFIGFVVVATVPVAIIGTILLVVGSRTAQEQSIAQLETVARIKETEIDAWIDSLEADLNAALNLGQLEPQVITLLRGRGKDALQAETIRAQLQQVLDLSLAGHYDELFVVNLQGETVISTDPAQEGKNRSTEPFFFEALAEFYIEPLTYSPALGRASAIAARPIKGSAGAALGLIAGRVNPAGLIGLMGKQAYVADTGEAYLVDRNKLVFTELRSGSSQAAPVSETGDAVQAAIDSHTSGSGQFTDYRGERVVGTYHWLDRAQIALVAKQNQSEALRTANSMLSLAGFTVLGPLVLAVAVSLVVTRSITRPLAALVDTSAQIAAGNLELEAPIVRHDEIGAVAQAFNTMTTRLRTLIGTLERHIAERTSDLERRSAYLEASTEIGRAASSVLDPDELAAQTVERIRDRFELYYVGLFLLDETEEWAVLRAGTGPAGRAMMARGHRIRVGEGMIGWSIAQAQPRVAQEAAADTIRLAMPELPETRSEAALPLRSRGRVMGALTVQDSEPGTFDPEVLGVLQAMADQIGVALDNARLFSESETALQSERRAYGEISRQAWAELIHTRPARGYRGTEQGVHAVAGAGSAEIEDAIRKGAVILSGNGDGEPAQACVPIQVRDHVVGSVRFQKSAGQSWTSEEVKLLQTLSEQLALALESARLYEDSQRRATQEQLVGEVTTHMRESLDVEKVLQTAVHEIGRALDLKDLTIRLNRGA